MIQFMVQLAGIAAIVVGVGAEWGVSAAAISAGVAMLIVPEVRSALSDSEIATRKAREDD